VKTVFFFFGQDLKSLYWERQDVVFFDEQGWWLIDGDSREAVTPENFIPDSRELLLVDTIEIVRRLRAWGPIWSRWCGRGDQYELVLREALLLVIQIASGLRKLNVAACIMHTGISHHVDSLIFEMASELIGIKVVFLYNNIFSKRLLPLIQVGTIASRKPLGERISTVAYKDVITEFVAIKQQDKPPKNNYKINRRDASWIFALFLLLRLQLKLSVRWLLSGLKNPLWRREGQKQNIFSFASNAYLFQYAVQVLQQRAALAHLRNIETDALRHRNLRKDATPRLLIAANFQPEATSFPEGWEMNNHIDIVLELRKRGYKDAILYKEHSGTSLYLAGGQFLRVGMYRSRRYYEQLEQLGCEFVATNFKLSIDPDKNDWYLPITITGTIAIERSLAGFHTIVTGHPWFKGLPGVLQLSEIESLSEIRPEWIQQDPDLARCAFDFLDHILSYKTITNLPGIGTGIGLNGTGDKAAFASEFDALLAAIHGNDMTPSR
jgi:hypothetical protein